MSLSIFEDKDHQPDDNDLEKALTSTKPVWDSIISFIRDTYPSVTEEWQYSKNYGWNLRVKSKKRTVIYFTPCDGYFKNGLVYGVKATDAALDSNLPESVKEIISSAKVYGEGRGFRLDVKDSGQLEHIKQLIVIKMKN